MRNIRFFVFVLIVSLGLVAAFSVSAAARAWRVGAVGSLASDPANWEGGIVPVSGEIINLPSGITATWDLRGIVPASFNTAADLTLQVPLIVSGALRVTGGSLKLGSQPMNVGGNFSIESGSFNAGGAVVNISGDWAYTGGSMDLAASTVTLNGSGAKSIVSGGRHFGTLAIAAAAGSVVLKDELNVDGALTLSDGVFSLAGKTATVSGGLAVSGGSLLTAGGKIVLTGTSGRPFIVSGGSFSADSLSTVEYRPAGGSVSIEPVTYNDLRLTGNTVFSLLDDTVISGELAIGAGATLSLGGHVLNLAGGSITNAGTISDGTVSGMAFSVSTVDGNGRELPSQVNSLPGTVVVRVNNEALNRRGSVKDSVAMAVTVTTVGGDRETTSLVETDIASGVFVTAPLVFHQAQAVHGNGQIEVGQNDVVFVNFTDPQDQASSKTVQYTIKLGSALVTGQPQIVDGPTIGNWESSVTGSGTTYSAQISWQTDVVSASAVTITSSQLTQPITAGSLDGTTGHTVAVSGLVRGRDYAFTVSSVTPDGKTVTSAAKNFTVIVPGDRIKSASSPAVYWYLNGEREVFPDRTSYDSWFADFSGVATIPADQLADVPLGKLVPVRAGTYLLKIQSDPKTYAVEPLGKLRWIANEEMAVALYGQDWAKRVRDVDVSQFVGYSVEAALAANDLPEGYVYRTAEGETNIVYGNYVHVISEAARALNGIATRFVSLVSPRAATLSSGGAVGGYEPELNGVLKNLSGRIVAPAFGS